MIASDVLTTREAQLADLIERQLGVRGHGLDAKLRKAGRLLPAWARREAEQLVRARQMAEHPKLAMRTDVARLDKGLKRFEKWLESRDPHKRRKDRFLGIMGTNAANLLIVTGGFVAYLVWAGHV